MLTVEWHVFAMRSCNSRRMERWHGMRMAWMEPKSSSRRCVNPARAAYVKTWSTSSSRTADGAVLLSYMQDEETNDASRVCHLVSLVIAFTALTAASLLITFAAPY